VISSAELTVAAQNVSRAFGVSNPLLTYQATGFVNGDTSSVLTGTAALGTSALLNSPAGMYPITIAQGTLGAPSYYNFDFLAGTITVSDNNFQRILFQPFPATLSLNHGTLTLSAYSTAALPVSYTATGPATVNPNGTLTLSGTGVVSVTATQAGNNTFGAAVPITHSFEVTQ
jgi:hypothetical protein